MHLPIKVKSPNNISNWQMDFKSAFKGLIYCLNGERRDCIMYMKRLNERKSGGAV
jgi:hypothetical protein